jgi:dihydrofolate reductase
MRNVILLAHLSLDGIMARPGGDMSFLTFDKELGDYTYPLINTVTTSVYGRVTYEIMESYWPNVAEDPNAGVNERSHARWYENVEKLVASRTLAPSDDGKTTIVSDDFPAAVAAAKRAPGGDIMIFGSPTIAALLHEHDLIDEWRLTIQPALAGKGLSPFARGEKLSRLSLRSTRSFHSGVIAVHYARGAA